MRYPMTTRLFFTTTLFAAMAGTASAQYYPANGQQPYCREFTKIVQVGGQAQSAYGTACYQPDGSWQILSDAIPASQPVQYMPVQNQVIYVPQPTPASLYSISFNSGPRYDSHRFYHPHRYHYHGRPNYYAQNRGPWGRGYYSGPPRGRW